jgi:hypothetical protein
MVNDLWTWLRIPFGIVDLRHETKGKQAWCVEGKKALLLLNTKKIALFVRK